MTIALKDLGLVQAVFRTVDRVADGVKINAVGRERRWGRAGIMKRRTPLSWCMTRLANFYFRVARLPIRFLGGRKWQRWEAGCFRMMNEGMEASAVGEDGVWAEKVPGKCLFEHLKAGTLRRGMVEAAGREFRRCHSRWSEELNGDWSHGDATMSNVMYETGRDRARFIDFEIMHVKRMPAVARHADDLLVFLLDLVSYVPERRWLPLANAFLRAYGGEAAVSELRQRLVPWRGLRKIWWKVRTNSADQAMVQRRLAELREKLGS